MQTPGLHPPLCLGGTHVRFTALHDRPLSGIWNWDFAESSRILAVSLLSRLRKAARGQGWDITSHTHRHKMNRIRDAGAYALSCWDRRVDMLCFFFVFFYSACRQDVFCGDWVLLSAALPPLTVQSQLSVWKQSLQERACATFYYFKLAKRFAYTN